MGNYLNILKQNNNFKQFFEIQSILQKKQSTDKNILSVNKSVFNKIFLNNGYGNIHLLVKDYCVSKKKPIYNNWITI